MTKKHDIIKQFTKLFTEKIEKTEDKIPRKERTTYYSKTETCAIIPKTQWVKDTLEANFTFTKKKNNITLDYTKKKDNIALNYTIKENDIGKTQTSKYDTTFLKMALKMTMRYDTLKIYMKRNYVLCVECEDLKILIAPRLNEEDIEEWEA